MEDIKEFYTLAQKTLEKFVPFIEIHKLKGKAKADHISYKCGSSEYFEKIRRIVEPNSKWIYQAEIAGRRIATIKLKTPIATALGSIDLLELSDQKPDGSQVDGFDHIEAYAIDGNYLGLVDYLEKQGVGVKKIERPHHTTHDVRLASGLVFRLTREPLASIIIKEQKE